MIPYPYTQKSRSNSESKDRRLCVAHLRQSVGGACAHRGMWILEDGSAKAVRKTLWPWKKRKKLTHFF